jgi:hypothetical protein
VADSIQRAVRIPYEDVLEGLGDFKLGGKVIRAVMYADVLVLLAEEERVLQSTIESLVEI